TDKINAHNDALKQGDPLYAAYLKWLKSLPVAFDDADFRLMQYTEDSRSAEAADNALAVSLGNATRAAESQAAQLALSAGMSGTITKAETDYQKVIDGNAEKIAKLKA